VKNVKTVSGFKRSYKKHGELVAPPLREKDLETRRRDGAKHFPRGPSGTTGSSSPSKQVIYPNVILRTRNI
jgi:hypothetical protein